MVWKDLTPASALPTYPQAPGANTIHLDMPAVQSSQPQIFTTPPPQPEVRKSGQLSEEDVKKFFEEGFLLVPDFFTSAELQPVIKATEKQVEDLAEKLFNAGKIKDKYESATFYDRLTLIEKEFPGAAVLLLKKGILPKAYQDLWTNERLLNVVEQTIGPEIAGHPVWNLRTKVMIRDPCPASVVRLIHSDGDYKEASELGSVSVGLASRIDSGLGGKTMNALMVRWSKNE